MAVKRQEIIEIKPVEMQMARLTVSGDAPHFLRLMEQLEV